MTNCSICGHAEEYHQTDCRVCTTSGLYETDCANRDSTSESHYNHKLCDCVKFT